MTKRWVRVPVVCAAMCLVGMASEARASTISLGANSNQSLSILWSQLAGTTTMTALGNFNIIVRDTYIDFAITLTNNTALANQKVHSIGFNTNPNATKLVNPSAGNYFKSFGLNQNFPSFQKIDICAWTTNNCAGGGQGSNLPGLGGSDTFGFRLLGNFSKGVDLSKFAIKFQGDLGSFEFTGTQVPEPASLLILGMGLAVAASRRVRSLGRRSTS